MKNDDGVRVIYKIENKIDHLVYIGQCKNIKRRKDTHLYDLRKNKHHARRLQIAWNTCGEGSFVFEKIEECDIKTGDERERFWIAYYESTNPQYGYNLEFGGNINKKSGEETKQLISENHADVSGSNNPFYGKKHSKETMNKILSSDGYIKRTEKVRGEGSHTAVLTTVDVIQIKKLMFDGFKNYEIQKIIGKGNGTIISHIRTGYTWKHVDVPMKK